MSRPLQKTLKKKRNSDVDDKIPAYCTFGQISEPNTVFKINEDKVGLLLTAAKLRVAQTNDVPCQNVKEVLRKDRAINSNEDGLLCRKGPSDGALQIVLLECYGKLYCSIRFAPHLLDVPEQKRRMISLEKHTVDPTRPLRYTSSCSNGSFVEDTGAHKYTSDGCSCFHMADLCNL